MSKYKVGDKVVIRKDLLNFKFYAAVMWLKRMEYLKNEEYVVIKRADSEGDYIVEDWCISDEMIEGLYEEGSK